MEGFSAVKAAGFGPAAKLDGDNSPELTFSALTGDVWNLGLGALGVLGGGAVLSLATPDFGDITAEREAPKS